MEYGKLTLNIERILAQRGISKNQICKDLDIPRSNFNKYCRSDFQRIDAGLVCKLCWYLKIDVGELIEYTRPE
ncbi:MAG: helix-turn-helix domain-containing protein [Candidatus Limivicinus sp.]|nr:helix-turn-helix transcriptional regulator [Clostridiales bacterium]